MMADKHIVEVEVGDGNLHVAHWPGDGPDLLLIHGISGSHLSWAPVVKALPEGAFNIFAPDLRGRGASNGLEGPYGLERHVDDLCKVINKLCRKPVALAGHSMGAYIGAVFGASRPDYLSRLVLVDGGIALPLPDGMQPETRLEKVLGPGLKRLALTFEDRAAYHEFWRQHPAFADASEWNDDVEAYFDYDLEGTPPTLKSRVREAAVRRDGLDPMQPEMVKMIDRVPTPMLMLTAVRGLLNQPDPLMPVKAVAAKVAAIDHLQWVEIADTNHYSITLGRGAVETAGHIAGFAGT
jgi:lipase